jgi:cell surface protein SprA
MSFTNNQMTDISSSELVFGLGYRFKEMELVLHTLGIESKKSKVKSDLNIKADLSIRNDKTVLRRLVEDSDQISAGKKLTSINISADYVMNQNLTIRAFFEKQITNPFVSTQYPNSTTNAGISLRFMLAQ